MGGGGKNANPVASANRQMKMGETMNTIGGVLSGLGSLADATNAIIQMSRGATPLPIGMPFQTLGQGITGIGTPMYNRGAKTSAIASVDGLELDDASKALLKQSIALGDARSGIRGAFNSLNRKQSLAEQYVNGELSPEQVAKYREWKQLNRIGGGGGGGGGKYEGKDYADYIHDRTGKLLTSTGMTIDDALAQGAVTPKDAAIYQGVHTQRPSWATQTRKPMTNALRGNVKQSAAPSGDVVLEYDQESGTFK
ncbi:four-alpha-helix bundle protein [Caudoviricetes sp.]|nr:four-alpha-helix bundle protein [Caudoviricetes sp.]